jgi:hypothetical protein
MCAKINIPTPPFVCKIILYYLPQQLSLHKVTVTSQSNDVVQKHTQNIKTLTYFYRHHRCMKTEKHIYSEEGKERIFGRIMMMDK